MWHDWSGWLTEHPDLHVWIYAGDHNFHSSRSEQNKPKQKWCFAMPTLHLKQVLNKFISPVSTNDKMINHNYLEKVSLGVLAELFHLGLLLLDFFHLYVHWLFGVGSTDPQGGIILSVHYWSKIYMKLLVLLFPFVWDFVISLQEVCPGLVLLSWKHQTAVQLRSRYYWFRFCIRTHMFISSFYLQ